MRGSVRLVTVLSAVCLSAHLFVPVCSLGRCDRTPSSGAKSPPDNRFFLSISGNPDKYVPNEDYTVTLQGEKVGEVPNKFVGFMLVAEAEIQDLVSASLSNNYDKEDDVGQFQTFPDSLTKFSNKCPNAVTHTSAMPKSEIQVLWTAPKAGSGCVSIKAMVVEHHDIWYMDGVPLSKTLCEESEDAFETQPMIVDPCCACDEAKYEVTFEGVWSRHTHPKDFPPNEWKNRFSDVIGASHSVDYRFWNYGQQASEGLRQVAEHGATRKLETELKAESEHIRTIIKARGIGFPNLNGKTFAVFRVDNRHHLISLVSMMNPSPDWIVGVSGLELCLKNCSWVESKVLNLYPWDAGTDSGPTYLSPDEPTNPPDVIKRIRTNFPNDPRSPFYDVTGAEMKPLARLYLSRQRLYEKVCDNTAGMAGGDGDGGSEGASGENGQGSGACATTQWGPWQPCSATCGRGQKLRQRSFLDPAKAESANCNKKLTGRQACFGPRHHCKVPSEDEPDPATHSGPCAVTQWSTWSDCSNRCGAGHQTRFRNYKLREAFKKCHQGYQKRPVMQQTMECTGTETDCEDLGENAEGTVYYDPNCPMTEWSEWSACLATCGSGKQMRSRLPAAQSDDQIAMVQAFTRLHKRWSFWGNSETQETEKTAENKDNEDDENAGPCKHMKTIEEVICHTGMECDLSKEEGRRVCSLPKLVGPCRGYAHRWFFDVASRTCEPFGYTGCHGNRNNFRTHHDCERNCGSYKEDLIRIEKLLRKENGRIPKHKHVNMPMKDSSKITNFDTFGGLDTDNQIDQNLLGPVYSLNRTGDGTLTGLDGSTLPPYFNGKFSGGNSGTRITDEVYEEAVGTVRNCKVSEWSDWTECSVTCGHGTKERSRTILQHPTNGGKPCPKLLLKHKPCRLKPCRRQSSRRNDEDLNRENEEDEVEEEEDGETAATWGAEKLPESASEQCVLSNWSPWSPCTETCGAQAVRIRTRKIKYLPPGFNPSMCGHREQKKTCGLLSCPYF